MSDITREEFASAVAATISSVHHLYREVTRLIEGLRDALSEEPGALIPVRGSAVGKSRLNPARFVVRDAYGALFKPVVSDEEVDAAEDDEEESDADADDGGQGRTRRPVELVADLPLLAVRMVLYDPRKQDGIEPQIQFGVMSDWRVGRGMSRALLKLSGSLVHDYATIADDSPSPNRASRARRAATSAGIS